MKTIVMIALALAVAAPAAAAPINVALGKPVTVSTDLGIIITPNCCGFVAGPVADPSTIADGILLAEGTQWQDGTVWWDERHPGSLNNVIEIDLLGLFRITDILLQADNNDSYRINYRDELGVLHGYADVNPSGNAGMRTRAGSVGVFLATAIQIDAFGGDQYYSVSEFQATGTPVPEPGTMLLFGAGAGAAALRRRYRRGNG